MTASSSDDHPGTPPLRLDRRLMLQSSLAAIVASGFSPAGLSLSPAATPEKPADARLGPLKNLDGFFPFAIPDRSTRGIVGPKNSAGKFSSPPPLAHAPPSTNLRYHSRPSREERLHRRSCLLRKFARLVCHRKPLPAQRSQRESPLILCPHGHWMNGRFFDHGELVVRKEIEAGAERYPKGGRFPLQARCFHLAKMGCVVFHYDMLGYADSVPIPASIAHGFKKQRPQLTQPDRWDSSALRRNFDFFRLWAYRLSTPSAHSISPSRSRH